jgi:hypothetical protein
MPENAIHKNDQPLFFEYHVRSPRKCHYVLVEPQAELSQASSHGYLWGSVESPNPRHAVTTLRGRKSVGHSS